MSSDDSYNEYCSALFNGDSESSILNISDRGGGEACTGEEKGPGMEMPEGGSFGSLDTTQPLTDWQRCPRFRASSSASAKGADWGATREEGVATGGGGHTTGAGPWPEGVKEGASWDKVEGG